MTWFYVDAEQGSACSACCCKTTRIAPGETALWGIDWSTWVAPIAGRGLVQRPSWTVNLLTCHTPTNGNLPPVNTNYDVVMTLNTSVTGQSVATNASDPNGDPLTFSALPLYPPAHGVLAFQPNGDWTYTPTAGFVGYDSFYFSTSDGINPPVIRQVRITVNPAAPLAPLPPPVTVPPLWLPHDRMRVNNPYMELVVEASPALQVGDVYRLELIQPAMDCDGRCFRKKFCIDVTISKC